MTKSTWREPLLWWLGSSVIITGLCIGLYSVGQQVYRQLMNDPQVELAEDFNGALPQGTIDMAQSLAPWVATYDASGNPLASSGMLNSQLPKLPQGVFDTSQWKNAIVGHHTTWWYPQNETRFTWQPESDVREVVVLVHKADGTFVASGRTMRESESRIEALGSAVLLGWALLLIADAVVCGGVWWLLRRLH